jgi:hypothetical protein
MWGLGEFSTWLTWICAALTLVSGLYVLYRERQERQALGK